MLTLVTTPKFWKLFLFHYIKNGSTQDSTHSRLPLQQLEFQTKGDSSCTSSRLRTIAPSSHNPRFRLKSRLLKLHSNYCTFTSHKIRSSVTRATLCRTTPRLCTVLTSPIAATSPIANPTRFRANTVQRNRWSVQARRPLVCRARYREP